MLFHVTLSHTVDNCPIYQKEMFPKLIVAAEGLEGLAKELNVKIHFLTVSAPEHIYFALLEADTLSAISRLVMSMPLRQQVKIVPVAHWLEGIAMAKDAMEAQNQD
jgi:hypothetical protein